MDRKRMETAADLAASIGKFYAKAFTQPMTAFGGSLAASQEMLRSLAGRSEIEPEKGDKRFKDPVWTSNPGYRFLMRYIKAIYVDMFGSLSARRTTNSHDALVDLRRAVDRFPVPGPFGSPDLAKLTQ